MGGKPYSDTRYGTASSRGQRGGSFYGPYYTYLLGSFERNHSGPSSASGFLGFRVASIPEPATLSLLALGGLGLLRRRRAASPWRPAWRRKELTGVFALSRLAAQSGECPAGIRTFLEEDRDGLVNNYDCGLWSGTLDRGNYLAVSDMATKSHGTSIG